MTGFIFQFLRDWICLSIGAVIGFVLCALLSDLDK